MTSADTEVARAALRRWGRTVHAPTAALAALTLVNSGGAAALALGLVLVITQDAPTAGLMLLAASLALRATAAWAGARLATRHARRVASLVRREAVAATLHRRRGDPDALGARLGAVVDEVEALDGYFARFAPASLEARIAPLAIAIAVALASPVAAVILLATLIPFVAVLALAGGAAANASSRQFEALARLSGHFVDRVRALPVILAFEAEARETAQVAAAAEDVSRRTLGVLRIAFISTAALEFFAALSVALVAVYCGFSLLGLLPFPVPETIDFPRAFLALALAPEFYAPLRRLAGAYHEKQLGEAAADRLGLYLGDQPTRPSRPPPPSPLPGDPPHITLDNVSLRLGDLVVGPIDREIPARCITALVGPTGSGKSSLLAAILGLTPLEAGAIRIDGACVDLDDGAASRAAWSGQAPVFLPGSVLDNLLAAAPDVTRSEAIAMLDTVGLGPAIAARPEGVNTRLDERGSGLSGGERRRLSLARALLKPAQLLVLDEPTADLDAAAEAEIIALLRAAAQARTVIVATHSERLATAAGQILRLP